MSELPSGTVTFLFTDLETSTRLWEQDADAMRAALARHDELLKSAVVSNGGHVLKHTGDGVLAVFATSDAAVAAAVDGQRALVLEPWGAIGSLRARMGLHTGVADERDGDYFGPVVNRAARLMAMAHAGQVLCSHATTDLARDSVAAEVGFIELGGYQLRDLQRVEVVYQLSHPDLPAEFPPLWATSGVSGNLPRQLTSFVGHERDLLVIPEVLASAPLVTLTGVGGVGKTRLALEVAGREAPRYRDGAWVCKLDGVRRGDAIVDAVLEVFGVQPDQGSAAAATLTRFLRAKQLLLVLDNCEHVLRRVARLAQELVDGCPDVKILATSREGLGISGERIIAVAALDVPEAARDLDVIARSGAVQLFTARAQAARSDFVLDASNAESVAQICDRLDGVPLAIELAAARVAMLTAAELAQRLDSRFRVLTGSERGAVERHQTLRAAIDWSYDLLDEAERRLLSRLSVFAGGFTLEAAEAVASEEVEHDLLELLAGLVAKSLVLADTHGIRTRYRLLETIRQYAEERLDQRGEAGTTRDAHARYFAEFSERVAAGLLSAQEPEWTVRAALETDNQRAALTWAIEVRDTDTVLHFFAPGAATMLSELGRLACTAARSVLELPGVESDPRWPIVLSCAAVFAGARGDHDLAQRFVSDAESAERRLQEVFPDVITARVLVALQGGRLDAYQAHQLEAIAIYRDTADHDRLTVALSGSAMAKALRGQEMQAAVAEIDEVLVLLDQVTIPSVRVLVQAYAAFVLAEEQPKRAYALMRDSVRGLASSPGHGQTFGVLGDVAERLGDDRLAVEYFLIGMDGFHWQGVTEIVGRMLRRIGLLLIEHDPQRAAILIGAGVVRSDAANLTDRVNRQHEKRLAELSRLLGADVAEALIRQGTALSENDAVALAHAAAERALADSSAHPRQEI